MRVLELKGKLAGLEGEHLQVLPAGACCPLTPAASWPLLPAGALCLLARNCGSGKGQLAALPGLLRACFARALA